MTTRTAQRTIREIMTSDPVTVTPEATLQEVIRTLDANEISGLPVVDPRNRVLGVVSKTDVIHSVLFNQENPGRPALEYDEGEGGFELSDALLEDNETIVQDIMNPEPITASPDEPVGKVARRMAEESVHRVLVVSESGELIGIVTSLDMLRVFPE